MEQEDIWMNIIGICKCGHSKDQHIDRNFSAYTNTNLKGHKQCKVCHCKRFTFSHDLLEPLTQEK